jgi:hypothetical protein
VLQLLLRRPKPNKSVEAYTGNHADRREDRTSLSLIQPRYELMQTAMLLTQQKPTQTDRLPRALVLKAVGEVREGLPGSTLERGMCEEKRQEPGRPCWLLIRLKIRLDIAWHTASEPTHGESLKLVGRSLNDLLVSSARLTKVGLLNRTKSGQRPSGSQISS